MHPFSTSEIQECYRHHPVQEKRILARILAERGTLDGITEQDLAEDPLTEITDQNHIGGTRFVAELARKSGIGQSTQVLDLGSGLGGSGRYLAYLFGCRVHGIDLSRERCVQAESLTRLVGLEDLVTFEFGDMTELPLPAIQFDVLWDQAAWVHIADKQGFLHKCAPCLRPGGCVALEDSYLKRAPASREEAKLLEELEQTWMSHLIEERVWMDALTSAGFVIDTLEDLSPALCEHSLRLIEIDHDAPENEKASWRGAIQLTECGVLGYCRIVARKNGAQG